MVIRDKAMTTLTRQGVSNVTVPHNESSVILYSPQSAWDIDAVVSIGTQEISVTQDIASGNLSSLGQQIEPYMALNFSGK